MSNNFSKREKARKERESKEINTRSETWLIVCEGEETEPNYFKSLLDYANAKTEKKIKFSIKGTGRNTESLVSSVDDFFIYVDDLRQKKNIPYGKVFTVFDKDSFNKGQFNNAIFKSLRNGYIPIWSNECIELWFLLHFILLESNLLRKEYFKKLSEIFGQEYRKVDDHFHLLKTETNLKTAMRNARRLFCNYEGNVSFADMAPCTTVFRFVEEIEDYIGFKLT